MLLKSASIPRHRSAADLVLRCQLGTQFEPFALVVQVCRQLRYPPAAWSARSCETTSARLVLSRTVCSPTSEQSTGRLRPARAVRVMAQNILPGNMYG